MAYKLLRDEGGAAFLEFTVVFPLLVMVSLGLVDMGLLMFGWADANRAVQAGARYAATSDPVASGVQGPVLPSGSTVRTGTYCVSGGSYTNCVLRPTYQCRGIDGVCKDISGSGGADLSITTSKLQAIVDSMKAYSRTLSTKQIIVTYTPQKQGYVGQPQTPMNVTVSLYCVGQQLFFVKGLLNWALQGCTDGTGAAIPNSEGVRLNFSATLPGEDMMTN